ncbi:NTP transferase domain-containing protein [Planctomycetota bacterium]
MICAVILAAGESRRMGAQKLLLPFGGVTVIEHIVDQLLNSAVNKVIVVTGYEGDRIADQISKQAVSVVLNPDYQKGMLSSVRCGLGALPAECEKVLVALGDQPALTTKLVNEMISSLVATDKGIIVPVYNGKRGHPILFSVRYCQEIMTHYDEVGLRGLMQAHPEDVFELEVSTSTVLLDMDCPDDYRRELERQRESEK